MLANQGQASELTNLAFIAANTTTLTGAFVDFRKFEGDIVIIQDVGVVSGTTPTLNGKIQDATDGAGTGVADVAGAVYTQVTASNNKQKITIPAGSIQGFLRYVGTIAGTTPSFTLGVSALSHPKYT